VSVLARCVLCVRTWLVRILAVRINLDSAERFTIPDDALHLENNMTTHTATPQK
jgi:hypothetical protein